MANKPYQPNLIDIAWARNLVESLSQGGRWASPQTGEVWRIDREKKELVLVNRLKPEEPELWEKYRAVFGKVGYQIRSELGGSSGDVQPPESRPAAD